MPKVPKVAVILHKKKVPAKERASIRAALEEAGITTPLWFEVPKSRKARKLAKKAAKQGAEIVFAWGGDGTVQRCVDAVAGKKKVALAIIPAGTSNLLARALELPEAPEEALQVGLTGGWRVMDTGSVNGEHFAIVAGAGMDALLVADADSDMKSRIGRAAYVYTGIKNANMAAFEVDVHVDGERAFRGACTTVLVANTREAVGGIELSEESRPDDGVMEVGIVTAEGPLQLIRTAARALVGNAEDSPFVHTEQGASVVFQFGEPVVYELDGGERKAARTLELKVHPKSLTVCVPA